MSKKAQKSSLRDAKASPFGRGGIAQAMTERASPSPESRHAAISWLFGRAMLSLRLFLFVSVLALSGAPRQLSQRESHWQAGPLPTGRPRPDMTQKGGPCYRGQQLRDNIPCQAVVNLDSGALLFPRHRALLVQAKSDRYAKGSPFGGNGDDRRQWRKQGGAVGAAASKTQAERGGCWEPQPGLGERSETERASPSPESRRTAISRFFVSAKI